MLFVFLDLRFLIYYFFLLVYWFSARCNKNSLWCSFCYLFDTSHFFFLLKKKTAMTNIPSNPKTTGKMLALEKFPISKTAAITIKSIPTNSAIFWNIMLHMLLGRVRKLGFLLSARICLARVRVICFSIVMGVLSAAGSAEFLRYVYRFLAFFAFVQ
jgi:hypothetical protein